MRLLYLNNRPETSSDSKRKGQLRTLLRGYASSGTWVDVGYPDDFEGAGVISAMQAQGSLTGLHHAMAIPSIVAKIFWAERSGYDAVVQANHFDPGVEPGRLAVHIPVVGPFRTGLHVAATLTDRVGILVPLEGHVPYVRSIIRLYGMERVVADIRPLGTYGDGLSSRKAEVLSEALTVLEAMVRESRAELILPLGGAIIPTILDPADLEHRLGIPIMNLTATAIRFAELCVGLGMTHSPHTYPAANLTTRDFRAGSS